MKNVRPYDFAAMTPEALKQLQDSRPDLQKAITAELQRRFPNENPELCP